MANNGIVNSLTFTGTVVGQATIQAQSVGGNLTFLLPNQVAVTGQLLSAQSINGNIVTLGWSNAQSLTDIPLSSLAQSGATTNQVIEWNGTAWTPTTKPVLSDGAGNPPSSGNNHIASGTGAITAGGNVTLSLSGAAAFTNTNYVVQVTRTNAVTGIGQLYAVPISGTQFSVSSSDNTDTTSTFAWTAIGF